MDDITPQQIADAIAFAVSEVMQPDEPSRIVAQDGLRKFFVRGEIDLELVAAALNAARRAE